MLGHQLHDLSCGPLRPIRADQPLPGPQHRPRGNGWGRHPDLAQRAQVDDFASLLKRLVPRETYYAHDDWDRRTENICEEDMEFGNGHSHCMSMLLGSAGESIPVRDGELLLGTWQRVLFIELDRERDRRWLVQVVGS